MANAGALQYTLGLSSGPFRAGIDAARGALGGFLGTASKLGNITTGLASARGIVQDVVGMLQEPIGLAAEMESLNAEMVILTGSADKARTLIADIKRTAASSPLETGGILGNAKTLLSFGIEMERIMPIMNMLTDIAGSSQDKLNSLTLAFAQISSTGRLTGQDLLQLVNAGFNPLTEISRTTGRSLADLRKDMEAGKISAEMIFQAFRSATSAGGLFFGNTAAQAETFKGKTQALNDAWADLRREFATPLMSALKPSIDDATKLIKEWAPEAVKFGDVLATSVRGVRELWRNGELGNAARTALVGAGNAFSSNIKIGIRAGAGLLGTGLRGAFQSGVALLQDRNFWDGIRLSALAITDDILAMLHTGVANVIDALPAALRLGADSSKLRKTASEHADMGLMTRSMAGEAFGLVDWEAVTKPLVASAGDAGRIIGDAFTEARDNLANNSDLSTFWATIIGASKADMARGAGAALRDIIQEASANDKFLYGSSSQPTFVPTPSGGYGLDVPQINTRRLDQLMGQMPQSPKAEDIAGKLVGTAWARNLLKYVQEAATKEPKLAGVF